MKYSSNHPGENPLSIDTFRSHILGVDAYVPILDGSLTQYINFDNAASTPSLIPVWEKMEEFLGWYSSVHRGTGFKSIISTKAYEESRQIVLAFLGGDPDRDTVIFGKNTTEAINKLANRYPKKGKDIILTTKMEHHSNDLAWRKIANVCYINLTESGEVDFNHLDDMLAKYANRIILVAITGASNVSGYINPVHEIAEKAHRHGAEILVDAAQLAPHRKIEMLPHGDPRHLDYVVLSAHKMYAPFGTGALIGKKSIFADGDPDMVGGGTVELVTLDRVRWTDAPEKEEAGSPNVLGAIALAASILALTEVGMEALASHETQLTAYLLRKIQGVKNIRVYGNINPDESSQRVGVISFNIEGMSHYLLAAILSMEGGIGVRNGCFCAHPYILELLKINQREIKRYHQEIESGKKSRLPGLVRISFGGYNTHEEIDRAIALLNKISLGEYRGEYSQDEASGEFTACNSLLDTSDYFSLQQKGGL